MLNRTPVWTNFGAHQQKQDSAEIGFHFKDQLKFTTHLRRYVQIKPKARLMEAFVMRNLSFEFKLAKQIALCYLQEPCQPCILRWHLIEFMEAIKIAYFYGVQELRHYFMSLS